MPRRAKAVRRPKPRREEPPTRAQLIERLAADPGAWWEFAYMDARDVPELAGVPPGERKAVAEEALGIIRRRAHDERDATLRERLRTTGPEAWGAIFCERPQWERGLTPEQRAAWREWLRERGISE